MLLNRFDGLISNNFFKKNIILSIHNRHEKDPKSGGPQNTNFTPVQPSLFPNKLNLTGHPNDPKLDLDHFIY
jgi:hypothetical protein